MDTDTIPTIVWPCLNYRDAHAAIAFLTDAFGFVATAVHESAPGQVGHAELRRPGGGGVMLGSAAPDGNDFQTRPPGTSAVYVVVDDPDALYQQATTVGAAVVRGLANEDYGSRGFTVRDPEGNLWSFSTYGGE